jgi:choline dehydrogenase-like flavoprotein
VVSAIKRRTTHGERASRRCAPRSTGPLSVALVNVIVATVGLVHRCRERTVMAKHVAGESDSATGLRKSIRANQSRLTSELLAEYDFIVCGSGPSGSVVARRLAENPDVNVLLLEAGGDDDLPHVQTAKLWPTNLDSERDWDFEALPDPAVNGRVLQLSMGKVLGGGSSINVMFWARGHRSDWGHSPSEAGDNARSYDSMLNIYGRIEDWHGAADPRYRGTGGPVFVQPAADPDPLALATIEAATRSASPGLTVPTAR